MRLAAVLITSKKVEVAPEGSLDRLLGLTTVKVDGRDLAEILIEAGLAARPGALERWGCPPRPKPAPKLPECKGLDEAKCARTSGCKWIKRSEPKDKYGRPLEEYCRRG